MATSVFVIAVLFSICWGRVMSIHRPMLKGNAIDAGETDPYNLFYQVDIRYNGNHVCSGAILGKYDILTTAHCVAWLNPANILVLDGSRFLNATLGTHHVDEIQTHPLFNPNSLDYDAAIIKVTEPFKFGRYVDKVELPQGEVDDLPPGTRALVSGWASKSEEGKVILAADVTMISKDECNQMYQGQLPISDRMICSKPSQNASVPKSCLADPGAPLVVKNTLYGMASWGRACETPGHNVVVYTDVSKLEYFTQRNMFIHERASAKVCAALQLIISVISTIAGIPAWVGTALIFLSKLLGC
ncbi:trypsin-4-like [Hetaerina americana]|uniref:trypsin-4-like n=1 Tax=Hetaerina americana TaxID=62018 RepID=UPI003A7F38B3